MPQPIVKPHLVPSKKDPTKTASKGRSVFYPVEIIDYLRRIDRLRNVERLSYREIANRDDIKRELRKFKLLKETELNIDTRVMDQGLFANFHSAKVNVLSHQQADATAGIGESHDY
jgi:hypothetical protein